MTNKDKYTKEVLDEIEDKLKNKEDITGYSYLMAEYMSEDMGWNEIEEVCEYVEKKVNEYLEQHNLHTQYIACYHAGYLTVQSEINPYNMFKMLKLISKEDAMDSLILLFVFRAALLFIYLFIYSLFGGMIFLLFYVDFSSTLVIFLLFAMMTGACILADKQKIKPKIAGHLIGISLILLICCLFVI